MLRQVKFYTINICNELIKLKEPTVEVPLFNKTIQDEINKALASVYIDDDTIL